MTSYNEYDWIQIEPHEMVLEGVGGCIGITANAILPSGMYIGGYDAVALTTSVTIDRPTSSPSTELETNHAYYGKIDGIWRALLAFLAGETDEFRFETHDLYFRVCEQKIGVRSAPCIEGEASDRNLPWTPDGVNRQLLLEREPTFNLRFAFQTSLGDPPFLNRFAEDLKKLVRHLNSLRST